MKKSSRRSLPHSSRFTSPATFGASSRCLQCAKRSIFDDGSSEPPLHLHLEFGVEEAIVNAMVAAETMEGINGNTVYALPQERVIEILKEYKRIP